MKLIKTKLQNELMLWYRSDDKYIGQRIALQKYEEYESELILRQVNKNSVVVDVGANIGYYTLLLAKVCKKVYAFEPDKKCFEILLKNIKENKLKNVVAINKAVSDKKGKVKFIHNKDNFGDSRIKSQPDCFVGKPPRNDEIVETVSLDDWWKMTRLRQETSARRGKIDLIKIDVQGHEAKVIEGAKEIIKKCRPALFLEFNGDYKMIDFLKKYYNNIFTIDYWFYVLRSGIKIDNKTGYADLMMGIKTNIWERYKNLQWKKVIKKMINL